ncbi:hypothetical protein [Marinimicrobium sp. ABcell2]|uniref:hypothetical protein n=1 Tax=Marinimicrobium sp. ABcell2 TaxID=3069751 RepID=UPI0027B67D03|nr:hypothetical protein [Marinimicrobium sp. ABcell2]MDQ2076841.1 hypothetical protein [Marinimicrobium sp. ABcell2]
MLAPTHPMQLALGLTVWALWFVVWYSALSLGCALAPPESIGASLSWINWLLIALSLPFIAVLLYWARRSWRASVDAGLTATARFIAQVAAGAHLVAAGAVVFMILPGLVLPPCV